MPVIFIGPYRRQGRQVRGYYRTVRDLRHFIEKLDVGESVRLPDGVVVERHADGFVVKGGPQESPERISDPQAAATRVLNRSARHEHPNAVGGERVLRTHTSARRQRPAQSVAEAKDPEIAKLEKQIRSQRRRILKLTESGQEAKAEKARTRLKELQGKLEKGGTEEPEKPETPKAEPKTDPWSAGWKEAGGGGSPPPMPEPKPGESLSDYLERLRVFRESYNMPTGPDAPPWTNVAMKRFREVARPATKPVDPKVRKRRARESTKRSIKVPESIRQHLLQNMHLLQPARGDDSSALGKTELEAELRSGDRVLHPEAKKFLETRAIPQARGILGGLDVYGEERKQRNVLRRRYAKLEDRLAGVDAEGGPNAPRKGALVFRQTRNNTWTSGSGRYQIQHSTWAQADDQWQVYDMVDRDKGTRGFSTFEQAKDYAEKLEAERRAGGGDVDVGDVPTPGARLKVAESGGDIPLALDPNFPAEQGDNVDAVLAAAVGHHGLPVPASPIRMIPMASRVKASVDGRYHAPYGLGGEGAGIELRSQSKRLSMAHELGHYIDDRLLPERNPTGRGYNYASEAGRARSKEMKKLLDAINKTEAVQNIRRQHALKVSRKYTKYLLQERELFARAYAQFLAEISRDPRMETEIISRQFGQFPSQWSSEDFKPVYDAMVELFEAQQWKP